MYSGQNNNRESRLNEHKPMRIGLTLLYLNSEITLFNSTPLLKSNKDLAVIVLQKLLVFFSDK